MKVFAAVEARDAESAVNLLAQHKQTHPERADRLLVGPFASDVSAVFAARPKILARIPEAAMIPLRSAAAMGFLVGELSFKRWLPEGFFVVEFGFSRQIAARMITAYVLNQRETAQWRRMGIVPTTKILNSQDKHNPPCAACRSLAHGWSPGEHPELPYEFCENSAGCRCVLVGSCG